MPRFLFSGRRGRRTGHTRRAMRTAAVALAALALVTTACSKDKATDTTAAASVVETTAAPADTSAAPATDTTGVVDTTITVDTTVAADTTTASFPLPEDGTFQMGIEPWLGYGGWLVAEKQGLFANNGIDVKIATFTTDDEINAALVAGKLDGANIATHTALRLKSEGTPITIVTLLDQSNGADAIIAKKTIKSIADLKGKKVAYEQGTTSDLLLNAALAANAMTLADITPVKLPAADVAAALQSGQVDVGVTYEPYITPFLAKNTDFASLYPASNIPGIVSDVFVVRDDVLKSKPGQIHGLLVSLGEAIDSYNVNPKAAQDIISTGVGAKPGELDLAFKGVKLYTTAEAKALLAGDFAAKTLPAVLKAATDAGIITKPVDTTKIIDPTPLQALR